MILYQAISKKLNSPTTLLKFDYIEFDRREERDGLRYFFLNMKFVKKIITAAL